MIDNAQVKAFYDSIETAIEQYGGAEKFLKAYTDSTESGVIAFKRHNKKMHKFLQRWLRMKIRTEKGLNVYGKGGRVLIAAK